MCEHFKFKEETFFHVVCLVFHSFYAATIFLFNFSIELESLVQTLGNSRLRTADFKFHSVLFFFSNIAMCLLPIFMFREFPTLAFCCYCLYSRKKARKKSIKSCKMKTFQARMSLENFVVNKTGTSRNRKIFKCSETKSCTKVG